MIRFVLFDLDDTLLDFHKDESVSIRKALTEMGVPFTEETVALYSKINAELWQKMERGEIAREKLLVERFERLYEAIGVRADALRTKECYENALGEGYFLVDGAIEVLKTLRETGKYKIYVLSNGTSKVQRKRIRGSGLEPYLDGVFLSEEVGHAKPDGAYFDYCFSHVPDFNKEQAIFIGDSQSSDLQGGTACGLRTVWFNPEGKKRRENLPKVEEVRTLFEFCALLDEKN